jgi:predicted nucleic acid-binding protein
VTVVYADTSAVVRAYFAGQPDHDELRSLLLTSGAAVVTSEITRIEFASAVHRAPMPDRARKVLLDSFDIQCGPNGPLALISLDPTTVLPRAHALTIAHRLRALDAIHLAVAVEQTHQFGGATEVAFATRDHEQAAAAKALGFMVR